MSSVNCFEFVMPLIPNAPPCTLYKASKLVMSLGEADQEHQIKKQNRFVMLAFFQPACKSRCEEIYLPTIVLYELQFAKSSMMGSVLVSLCYL